MAQITELMKQKAFQQKMEKSYQAYVRRRAEWSAKGYSLAPAMSKDFYKAQYIGATQINATRRAKTAEFMKRGYTKEQAEKVAGKPFTNLAREAAYGDIQATASEIRTFKKNLKALEKSGNGLTIKVRQEDGSYLKETLYINPKFYDEKYLKSKGLSAVYKELQDMYGLSPREAGAVIDEAY